MDSSFPIGSSVVLQNLINGATYNRLRGIVKSDLDPTSLRQNVFIITANKTIAIRPTNMKHCVPTENYDDVLFMSIKELKEELQSYNISTESYFDKTSLVDAVRMARRERWRQPVTVSVGISAAGAQSEHERTSTAANNGSNDGRDGKASSAAAASDTTSFSNGYQSKKRTAADTKASKKKKANELPTEVALAKTWNENTSVTGYYMSEKLDGMRCMWDGKGNIYSRNGNLICAPLFFTAALPVGTVLDGELFLGRGQFQHCMSIAKQSNERDWRLLTLVVFDAPLVKGDFETRLQAARDALARSKVDTSIAKVMPHTICRGKGHVLEELDRITNLDGEGVMLRNPTAEYKGGRTSDLLKVKKFHDAEARVVGQEEGKGRNAGRLGALVCTMMSGDGKQFKVGSGFTDSEREWENCPHVGSVISYRYFELTNDGKPRFPTFARVRPSE